MLGRSVAIAYLLAQANDWPKPAYAKGLIDTVTDSPPHSTLREWRDHMTSPVALCALGGTAVILTVVAPYQTADVLRLLPRFTYWLAMVLCTYSAGYFVNLMLTPRLTGGPVRRTLLIGVATALAVAVVVLLLNGGFLGYWPDLAEMPVFLGNIGVIALVVAVIFQVLSDQSAAPNTADATARPSLLDRLPFDKRGTLMALSVEDHYVRVQTSKGSEMLLLRLSDAMREVGATPGLQVHRSHWVAIPAVARARREGDRAVLTLTNDSEIPVSRRYVPAVKEAGLLPRS